MPLLSVFAKVAEVIAYRRIHSYYLNTTSFLSNKQFGFFRGLSTETLLIRSTDQWVKSIDNGDGVLLILLVPFKASGSANHDLIMIRRKMLGFYGAESE